MKPQRAQKKINGVLGCLDVELVAKSKEGKLLTPDFVIY